MKNNQRKSRGKMLVDRKVQGALTRRVILQWLLFFTVAFITLPFWELILSGDFLRPVSNAMTDSWKNAAPVFILMLALLPAFVRDTMALSNRFAGPMFRLRTAIRAAADGETVKPIKFRDGDFWQDVAHDFNRLLERIQSEQDAAADRPETSASSEDQTDLELAVVGEESDLQVAVPPGR